VAGTLLVGLCLLAQPAAAGEPSPAVLDALFPEGRRSIELEALIRSQTLAPDEGFRIVEVGRDATTSHHLVWIRDREVPHRHDRHDLIVVMLRGQGTMRLRDETRPVGEGSILYVPRGTPHAFRNQSGVPAVAYAIYTPAFDGEDRLDVDSGSASPPPRGARAPHRCRSRRGRCACSRGRRRGGSRQRASESAPRTRTARAGPARR
jgi:mannose-6-phosphate isomerase-like protein (cupin superfamily)